MVSKAIVLLPHTVETVGNLLSQWYMFLVNIMGQKVTAVAVNFQNRWDIVGLSF